MFTNNLTKVVTTRKKRIGRGGGSGKGFHTVGRGQKGQKSRSGFLIRRGLFGDKNTLIKRLPMIRGFKSRQADSISLNIALILKKNIFEINNEVLASFSSHPLVKLVGPRNYEGLDLSKVSVSSEVVMTKKLREQIVAGGGNVAEA